MRHDVASTREQSANGPDTDGVRRACGDSDPVCIVWSSWTQSLGLDIHSGFSNHSRLPMANFPCYSSFFFPFLDHIRLSCRLRPCHTFFLQNHVLLLTLGEHYFINPLWISRSNTRIFSRRIFVAKAVRRCNLVKVLGQQPRYQRVPSSVTMWQLFHRALGFITAP